MFGFVTVLASLSVSAFPICLEIKAGFTAAKIESDHCVLRHDGSAYAPTSAISARKIYL